MTKSNIALRDPRLGGAEFRNVVSEGPRTSTYQPIAANNQNSFSPTYTITPASPIIGLGRYVRQQVTGTITVGGTNLNAGVSFALRPWALASITNSVSVQVNNSTLTLNQVSSWASAFSAAQNGAKAGQTVQSGTSAAPDVYWSYSDAANSACSPFAASGDQTQGDAIWQSRTEQITGITYSDDGMSAVISFAISEPLFCPPFTANSSTQEALFGVNSITVTAIYNTGNAAAKILCVAIPASSGATLTSANLALQGQNVLVNYITGSTTALVQRPIRSTVGAPGITYYSSPVGTSTVLPGMKTSSVTFASQTVTILPRYLVLWASRNAAEIQTPTSISGMCTGADGFLPISGLQIQLGANNAILAGATVEQLYERSQANGLNCSLKQFRSDAVFSGNNSGASISGGAAVPWAVRCGAPIIIDVANDLQLDPHQAPGMLLQTQISWQCQVTNPLVASATSAAQTIMPPLLNMLIITDGVLECEGGGSKWTQGGLTIEEIARARDAGPLSSAAIEDARTQSTLSGGGFGDFLKGLLGVATQVLPVVGPLLAAAGEGGEGGAVYSHRSIRDRLAHHRR